MDEQEQRDAMPAGAYRRLLEDGVLTLDPGRRVVRPELLIDRLLSFGPSLLIGDEFRRPQVADAINGRVPWVTRRTRWSELTEDITHLRQFGNDGDLSVTPESRRALRMALAETSVVGDDDGNVRLRKLRRGRSRDDLGVALVMVAGAHCPDPEAHRRRLPWERWMSRHHLRLNRRRWSAVRWQLLTAAGFRCQSCGRPGRLEVHHRVALADGNADPYDPAGLVVYCRRCHFAHHRAQVEEKLPPDVREWRRFLASSS